VLLLLLVVVLTVGSVVQGIVSVHLLAILQARGLELAAAVALGALVGPSQVGARVVEKLSGGRFHPVWTMLASVVLVAAGLGLLWADLPVLAACLVPTARASASTRSPGAPCRSSSSAAKATRS
jgi:hypothetical protein